MQFCDAASDQLGSIEVRPETFPVLLIGAVEPDQIDQVASGNDRLLVGLGSDAFEIESFVTDPSDVTRVFAGTQAYG